MLGFERISATACFGGVQASYAHDSAATGTRMRFSVFHPPAARERPAPVLWWLSGLTCTEDNFPIKSGAQRVAAELGLMLVAPDTSPRGPGVADDPDAAYDFGLGAGFYLDATVAPFAAHYRMYAYVAHELPDLIRSAFPDADMTRQSISGHSMGGHGALTLALKQPDRFRSVSAFAPIVSPMNCPWGVKALTGYLGPDVAAWRAYDSTALIDDGASVGEILIDQGDDDPWLAEQLKPELLEAACARAGQPLTLRRHPDYDHGFFFIMSFIEEHLRWHAQRLGV